MCVEATNIEEVAAVEYLEVVKNEYSFERGKRQSFEARAGLIITIIGALFVFLFDKVKLKHVLGLMNKPLSMISFLEIIAGFLVYIGAIYTVFMFMKAIKVELYKNYDVESIEDSELIEDRVTGALKIIITYKDIIKQHRKINNKKAKNLDNAFKGLLLTLISLVLYINLI